MGFKSIPRRQRTAIGSTPPPPPDCSAVQDIIDAALVDVTAFCAAGAIGALTLCADVDLSCGCVDTITAFLDGDNINGWDYDGGTCNE